VLPEADILGEPRAATLAAVAARLIPSDENGPGAEEAMAARYILRALADDYRQHLGVYADALDALERCARLRHGCAFTKLEPEQQDELLRDVEAGVAPDLGAATPEFFELVRRHVIEGMFGDPAWGGNVGCAGWRLLGYPGPRLAWSEEDQRITPLPAAGQDPDR
jgi:hypothetical protein